MMERGLRVSFLKSQPHLLLDGRTPQSAIQVGCAKACLCQQSIPHSGKPGIIRYINFRVRRDLGTIADNEQADHACVSSTTRPLERRSTGSSVEGAAEVHVTRRCPGGARP